MRTDPKPATACHAAFADLLDVQFWQMGCDVEHPDGNLLCSLLGFTKQPPPRRSMPSRYRRTTADLDVLIWRCGLLLNAPSDAVLLVRGLAPVTIDPTCLEATYDPQRVFGFWADATICSTPQLGQACRWFAGYETTVRSAVGVDHRRPRPGSRPALAPPEPCSLEREWMALAERIR